jgi:preprotein translocase subunit SecG
MITAILYVLFFLAAVLLIFIILLQEGKGGGIADAFGGAGAQTFGVRAGGVNRVTMVLFAIFVLTALALARFGGDSMDDSLMKDVLIDQPAATPPLDAPPTDGQ